MVTRCAKDFCGGGCSKAHAGADKTEVGDTRGVGKCWTDWERFGLGSHSAAVELAPGVCSTSSRKASRKLRMLLQQGGQK